MQDFDSASRDVIRAAYKNGPLDAGDLPSKAANSRLCALRYMTPIVVKAEEGYYALTYKGSTAYKIISYIDNIEKSQKKELDSHSQAVLDLNPTIDKCDLEHTFLKLPGHPKNSMGQSKCPICCMEATIIPPSTLDLNKNGS